MIRPLKFDIMLITDPQYLDWVGVIERALQGAPQKRVAVQLRAETLTHDEIIKAGKRLRAATLQANATLLVNTHLDVAKSIGADGVHCKASGPAPAAARAILGPSAIVGVACHDAAAIARANRMGADYVLLSPFAAVPGKAPPLGPQRFASLAAASNAPVFALGGIDAHRATEAQKAGASGVALIRSIYKSDSPADTLRALCQSCFSFSRAQGIVEA